MRLLLPWTLTQRGLSWCCPSMPPSHLRCRCVVAVQLQKDVSGHSIVVVTVMAPLKINDVYCAQLPPLRYVYSDLPRRVCAAASWPPMWQRPPSQVGGWVETRVLACTRTNMQGLGDAGSFNHRR
jgi:hypothetical protein